MTDLSQSNTDGPRGSHALGWDFYGQPEKFGLTEIAELDVAGAYEFDKVVVWRYHDGRFWAATDSGCSCPMPFENHKFPTDFTEIRTIEDVRPLLEQLSDYRGSHALVFDFIQKVREALS